MNLGYAHFLMIYYYIYPFVNPYFAPSPSFSASVAVVSYWCLAKTGLSPPALTTTQFGDTPTYSVLLKTLDSAFASLLHQLFSFSFFAVTVAYRSQESCAPPLRPVQSLNAIDAHSGPPASASNLCSWVPIVGKSFEVCSNWSRTTKVERVRGSSRLSRKKSAGRPSSRAVKEWNCASQSSKSCAPVVKDVAVDRNLDIE